MASVTSKTETLTKLTLLLTEEEKRIMSGWVQNSIGYSDCYEEPVEEGKLREAIFNALNPKLPQRDIHGDII